MYTMVVTSYTYVFESIFVFLPQVARLRRHSNLLQLRRYAGYHTELDAQGKQELVDICRHYYRHGLKLSRNQVPTLNKPCDFYIVLATHLKIELYQETGTCTCACARG